MTTPIEAAEPRYGWRVRYLNPFRLASYLLLLFCLGHTRGGVLAIPSFGTAGDSVLAMMKSVHFRCMSSDCTWFGFYAGFGLFASIFLFLSAALTWYLGGLSPSARRALLPITWMLFLAQAAGAVLAWTYFFLAPQVFSTAIAGLLGFEAVRQTRSATRLTAA